MTDKEYVANPKKNMKNPNLKSFGVEKPAIPGPGRPRLPESVKSERRALQEMLKAIAPSAIKTLDQSLGSDDEKNRIRASEIILSHTVPRLEEVETNDNRPLERIPDEQLESKLAAIRSSRSGNSAGTGTPA